MTSLRKITHALHHSMQRSLLNATHQLVAVGAIAFLGLPLFYWLWSDGFPFATENLGLQLFGSLLGLGLMLTPFWPTWTKPFLPWYWFLTILYVLSFFFAFTFLINPVTVISSMSLLCSVLLLVMLVDLLSLTVLLGLGWSLAFICYYLSAPHMYLGEEHIEMSLIVLFVVIAGSTVNYKASQLQQQRMAGMAAAAGMIAHELRTPLLGIKSGAQALATHLPVLFTALQASKESGELGRPLRGNRLKQLEGVSERIINEIDYANTIIDMLLVKAGQENSLQHITLEVCSMATCLSEAIARYPFRTTSARALVSWQGDFSFMGSKLLMQHVLFNLLKNALYAIATAQRGEITMIAETKEHHHVLYVKDTAHGLSKRQLSRLFEHFYTTTFMGTGLGLSFCRLVMERFGGSISCDSEEGVYTTFTLTFPKMQ